MSHLHLIQKPSRIISTEEKLYTENSILISSFIGGPLVACYLLSKNFEAFGQKNWADKAFTIGVFGTLILFGFLLFVPEDILSKINFFIPLSYTVVIFAFFRIYQQKNIVISLNNHWEKHSIWKVIGLSVLSLTLTFLFFWLCTFCFFE
ncbi:MAG: hypothetical protein JSS53_00445 [Proteobacteria bacterium]|nr:hypothetical protein [Pseudomonadota bacterium]